MTVNPSEVVWKIPTVEEDHSAQLKETGEDILKFVEKKVQ